MKRLEIHIQRKPPDHYRKHLIKRNGALEVFIPVKDIGLSENLRLLATFDVNLKRCTSASTFLLSIKPTQSNQRPYLKIQCKLVDNECHVELLKCQMEDDTQLNVRADKVSVAQKVQMKCRDLTLECDLGLVFQSKLKCPFITLKSKNDVRFSQDACLKAKKIEITGTTVFVDGRINCLSNCDHRLKDYESLLSIKIDGNLHTGRDCCIQSSVQRHRSKNVSGILYLDVRGQICNHGTIQAANMIEMKSGSLLSCRTCDKDTASHYFRRIEQKYNLVGEYGKPLAAKKLNDAIRSKDPQLALSMLKCGSDPLAPHGHHGMTPTKTAERLQWKTFRPQVKYDIEYTSDKKMTDITASVMEAWNKRTGSIISPSLKYEVVGDLEDFSQVTCNEVNLNVSGDIIVEDDSICTSGDIGGTCKGNTFIDGQDKIRSFKSFNANKFFISETGSLFVENGGNLIVDEGFYNKSFVYNRTGQLLISTGVFEQLENCLITSEEALVVNINKESNVIEGSIEANNVQFCIYASINENLEIRAKTLCKFEFQKEVEIDKNSCWNHRGNIEVENGNIHIEGEVEIYNHDGSNLTCRQGHLSIQDVQDLNNAGGASIEAATIEIVTYFGVNMKKATSARHDLQNNGKIISKDDLLIAAGNIQNNGTMQSLFSSVELHYAVMANVETRLEGTILATECLHMYIHRSSKFHCSFSGGYSNETSKITLPKEGMFVQCNNGNVIFHSEIKGNADLLVESMEGFDTLKDISVRGLTLRLGVLNRCMTEVIYDRQNEQLSPPVLDNDPSNLLLPCDLNILKTEMVPSINILHGSVVTTDNLKVESECNNLPLILQTSGDSEMILINNLVCETSFILDGYLTVSGSSQIVTNTLKTTKTSDCKIKKPQTGNYEDICNILAFKDIDMNGKLYSEPSSECFVNIESESGNIKVNGAVKVSALKLVTSPDNDIDIKGHINLEYDLLLIGAHEIKFNKPTDIECYAISYQRTFEESEEKRQIYLAIDGIVEVHGPVEFDDIDRIDILGCLSCQGISANTGHVKMTSTSITKILPPVESYEAVYIAKENTCCIINSLLTEETSIIKLYSNPDETYALRFVTKWQHHGCLELIKREAAETNHKLKFYVNRFVNRGNFRNIDTLHITCDIEFSNFSSISARYILKIYGTGDIQNNTGAEINCETGPLLISIKGDVNNDGKLISNDANKVESNNMKNKGSIQSWKSVVELHLETAKHISLEGVILSPVQITFITPNSREFCFSSCGGISSDLQKLGIPPHGMIIECNAGSVILNTEIEDEENVGKLLVLCKNGCTIKKNMTIGFFHIVRSTSEISFVDQVSNCQKDETDRLKTSKTEKTNLDFYLWMKGGCRVLSREVRTTTNNPNAMFVLKTDDASKLVCFDGIINLDSKLFISGNVEISSVCEVLAMAITFDKVSKCKLFVKDQNVYMRDTSETATIDTNECKFQSESDIQIFGQLSSEKEQTKIIFICKSGNVIINGVVNLHHLFIAAAPEKSIELCKSININGYLCIGRGKTIKMNDQAVIQCKTFSCKPVENTFDELNIEGQLHVFGPSQIEVDTCCIAKTGKVFITTDDPNDDFNLTAVKRVEIRGRFECNLNGFCYVDCKGHVSLTDSSKCLFSVNECIFTATEEVYIDNTCSIEMQQGKLYLSNASESDTTIHGRVTISGLISGPKTPTETLNLSMIEIEGQDVTLSNVKIQHLHNVDLFAAQTLFIDSDSHFEKIENLEMQATEIDLKGVFKSISQIKMLAATSLLIDKDSKVDNRHNQMSEQSFKIIASSVEIKGQINYSQIQNRDSKAHFDVSNMLCLGKIVDISEIKIEADCTFVNSGEMHCEKTGIVAPICLICPPNFDGSTIDQIPQLGGSNQKALVVEGLLCIVVGSYLQAKSIDIKSIMNFKFSEKMSTIPNSGDLERWKSVVNSSLSSLPNANSSEDIHRLVQQAMKIQPVVCNLAVSSHLCKDIVKISRSICEGGLQNFNMNDLITSLDNAHSVYSQIAPLKAASNFIRIKLTKLKDRSKKEARKLIDMVFGPNSFSNSLEFSRKDGTDVKEGITSKAFIDIGKNTDIRSGGDIIFTSLEFHGSKGLWENVGNIKSCGDMIISASSIKHVGGQNRVMKALQGSIQLSGDNADIDGVQSKHLDVNVRQRANVKSITVEEGVFVSSETATIQNIAAKQLVAEGKFAVDIQSANIQQDIAVSSQSVGVHNVNTKSLNVEATKSICLQSAHVQQGINLKSGDTIEVKNTEATILDVSSVGNSTLGNVKVERLHAESKLSSISLSGTIKAKEATLQAKHGNISLIDRDSGKANHEFGTLNLNTRAMKDIDSLMNTTDIYKDLKIADRLGLDVSDQNVIIASKQKSQFSICLKAASIDVRNDLDAQNVELEATKGPLKINKNVNIRSKKNINLKSRNQTQISEGASVKAKGNIGIESKSGSVNMFACDIEAGGSLDIKAKHDINIMCTGSGGPCKKSTLSAGRTDQELAAIKLEAGNNINIKASDVKSQGRNEFKAGKDISITANIYETKHTKTKKSLWGLRKRTTETTTTHVEKPEINGKFNVFTAGGSFKSVASNIKSECSTAIKAVGKVSMLDVLATTRTRTKSSFLGIRYHQKKQSSQQSYGTILEDSSLDAETCIQSETSDIEWRGSFLKSAGNVSEIAERGKISHSSQILTHKKSENGFGFYSKKSKSDETDNSDNSKTIGFKAYGNRKMWQTTSNDLTEIGGNYTIRSKQAEFLKSSDVDVSGDMRIIADEFKIEGASLASSDQSFDIDIGLKGNTVNLSAKFEKGKRTSQQKQNLNVAGGLHFDNIRSVKIDNSDVEVGSLTGQVENMEVSSRTDTEYRAKVGLEVAVDTVRRVPTGGGFDIGWHNAERVEESTLIKVHDGSKGLRVETLLAKGASVVFDGDVHDFAGKIVSQDIHEKANEFNIGFRVSKPTKMLTGKKKIDLGLNVSRGRYKSCITSTNGTVHSSVANQINTDLNKCREVDLSLSYSFSCEFEGKIAPQVAKMAKEFVKTVGKEALMQLSHRLAKEFGIPEDIIDGLLCIIDGGITQDKIFQFVLTSLDKLGPIQGFGVALKSLLIDGNPENLIKWICAAANIDKSFVIAIIDIFRGKKISKASIVSFLQQAAKYFGISDEFLQCITILLDTSSGDKNTIQRKLSTVAIAFVKSKEGMDILKRICKAINISDEILVFVVDILNKANTSEMAMLCVQTIALKAGISTDFFNAVIDMVKSGKHTPVVRMVCKALDLNDNLTSLIVETISDCGNFKSVATSFIMALSKYVGFSNEVLSDIKQLTEGKKPRNEIHILVLEICIQIGRSTLGQKGQSVVDVLGKLLGVAKESKDQIANAISFGKQLVNGEKPTSGIHLLCFLLRLVQFDENMINGIERLLIDGDVGILTEWLSKVTRIEEKILIEVGTTLMKDHIIKSISKVLLRTYSKRLNLNLALTEDLECILDGKLPEKILKELQNTYNKSQESDRKAAVFAICKGIDSSGKVGELVFSLMEVEDPESKIYACFCSIASQCGIPEGFVLGVIDLVQKKNHNKLILWFKEETCTTGDLIDFVLTSIENKELDFSKLVPVISSIGQLIGLSENQQKGLDSMLQGNVNNVKEFFVQVICKIVKQHVPNLSNVLGIPPESLERLVDIKDPFDPRDLYISVTEIVVAKIGLPNELSKSVQAIIFESDCKPLSDWLGNWLGINKTLLRQICETVQSERTTILGLQKIPICIARHYNLSEKTIECLQTILKGHLPKCESKEILFFMLQDIIKVSLSGKWMDSIFFEIERKTGISKDFFIVVKNFLLTRDPLQAIEWACKYFNIDEQIVSIATKIFDSDKNVKSLLIETLVVIGKNLGISADLRGDLKKILMGKKPKREVPIIVLDIVIQLTKSVGDTDELIDSLENLKTLATASAEQLCKDVFAEQLKRYIPIIAERLNVSCDLMERIICLHDPFNISDLSSALIEFISLKAGLPASIVQLVKVFGTKDDTKLLCRIILEHCNLDEKLVLSILTCLKTEKTLMQGISKALVCLARHYNISPETISFLKSLTEGQAVNCDLVQLMLSIIKDLCKLCFDKSTGEIFETFCKVMETRDLLEKAVHILRYFSVQFDIPMIYIEAFEELVKHQDFSKLVAVFAEKLDIDKNILMILVNALRKGESPKQILKNLAKVSGVPVPAIAIIDEMIKQQSLKNKTPVPSWFTKPIR